MSTSMLASKMQGIANSHDLPIEVEAFPDGCLLYTSHPTKAPETEKPDSGSGSGSDSTSQGPGSQGNGPGQAQSDADEGGPGM